MSKVTDCARALGQAIVDSEEYKAMQITEKTAMNDPAVAAAMSRYLEGRHAHRDERGKRGRDCAFQPGDGRRAADAERDACG